MTVARLTHILAGMLILASLALTRFVHPGWVWFTVFIGVNLLQSGVTNWCLMSSLLRRFGVPEVAGQSRK